MAHKHAAIAYHNWHNNHTCSTGSSQPCDRCSETKKGGCNYEAV